MNQSGYALITGASSGIGECFARALAARKHDLALVARSKEKLDALAGELAATERVQAEVFACDLGAPGVVEQLVGALSGRALTIDLLVNNAGFGARGEFWKLPLARQEEMLRLNIEAPVELAHRLAPAMVETRRGGIINVASTAAFQPVAYTTTYAASKAFFVSFSMALTEELRPYGVRVVTLCPGGTETNFFKAGQYGGRVKIPGGLQPPEEVVAAALDALDHGTGLVVPRLLNKIGVFSLRLASRNFIARIAARVFRP